jgi:hypothetical protein
MVEQIMPKAEVTAKAFSPITGTPFPGVEARPEIIDLETNELFKECKTLTDVAETYMRYWNRLPSEQSELVLVQSIKWV